jgi:2'-deoxynucleoside 5'-phosphate N-hydrolase
MMRVYFTASLRGKKQFGDNYAKIVRELTKLGCKVDAEQILNRDTDKTVSESHEEIEMVYKKLQNLTKKADFVVAEISTPSVSVGHEISYALDLSKPVIVLHTKANHSTLLEGNQNDKLQVLSYDLDNVGKVLSKAIEEVSKKMDVRFNFFVSPEILAYLDWVAQDRMIPRSVFLRDLIEKEMKKDKDFKG